MKTALCTVLICLMSISVFAQAGKSTTASKSAATATKKADTCYDQWYAIFKERGAMPVADGTHEVIISLRSEYGYQECFFGRIDVKDGKLASKLQIQKVDGSYEDFDRKVSSMYMNAEGVVKEEVRDVTNGMSETLSLSSGERIRLFFYKALAEKAKANKKAPDPSALIKN